MKEKLLKQLQIEVDTSFLYKTIANHTSDMALSGIYQKMSEIEEGHAAKIIQKSKTEGSELKMPSASFNARMQVRLADIFGYGFILSGLMNTEKTIARATLNEKLKNGSAIKGDELNHVKILENLMTASEGVSGSNLARIEGQHRSVGGNALRAAVMGSNDGLVSNLSLIMGVAGAIGDNKPIVIAGMAGLLAGAISMALGEWLSVQSSRELYLRQIQTETEEFENSEDEELMELTLIYQAKGLSSQNAAEMAKEVFKNKESAIDTLVKEELGLDIKDPGGSAWVAAGTSFGLFAAGAVIPLLPFLFVTSINAVYLSLAFSTIGLFIIGGGITLYTGKGILFSGLRQVLFGLGAAALTFTIGKLIGVTIS